MKSGTSGKEESGDDESVKKQKTEEEEKAEKRRQKRYLVLIYIEIIFKVTLYIVVSWYVIKYIDEAVMSLHTQGSQKV